MKKRVVAIIQARMGSTRLPGKALKGLSGRPVIQWVIERVRRAKKIDDMILAITEEASDDVLADFARKLSVKIFRGSRDDVLTRFIKAAQMAEADVVVRICADNPLVAPEEIDRAVNCYLQDNPDYCFNHVPRLNNKYPDGFGVEVLSAKLLSELIHKKDLEPWHREHVTAYVWDHADEFHIQAVPCPVELQTETHIKLDIDTAEDFERMARLCAHISPLSTPTEILKAYHSL